MPPNQRSTNGAGVTPRFAYRKPLEQVARRAGHGYLKVFEAFMTLATCALSPLRQARLRCAQQTRRPLPVPPGLRLAPREVRQEACRGGR